MARLIGSTSRLASPERAQPSRFSELARWASRAELAICEVAGARNDPIKLHRLLDVFDSLNKLRLDFKLFGSKACAEI